MKSLLFEVDSHPPSWWGWALALNAPLWFYREWLDCCTECWVSSRIMLPVLSEGLNNVRRKSLRKLPVLSEKRAKGAEWHGFVSIWRDIWHDCQAIDSLIPEHDGERGGGEEIQFFLCLFEFLVTTCIKRLMEKMEVYYVHLMYVWEIPRGKGVIFWGKLEFTLKCHLSRGKEGRGVLLLGERKWFLGRWMDP